MHPAHCNNRLQRQVATLKKVLALSPVGDDCSKACVCVCIDLVTM